MANTHFEIAAYLVSLKRSGRDGELALIDCFDNTSQKKLTIYFMPTTATLEPNISTIDEDTGIVKGVIYQPADKYAWYLDLLRNEGPNFALINRVDPNRNGIITGLELVGDGDIS